MLSITKNLQAAGLRPRYHGNGFTQLYLSPSFRLHAWHPDLPVDEDNNATIHDHIWDMTSEVLRGKLGHRTFNLHRTGQITHDVYWINQPAVREETGDVFTRAFSAVPVETGEYEIAQGSAYAFAAGQFHESYAVDPLTVTLMQKGPDLLSPGPRLLAPFDEEPFQAFGPGTQPAPEALWKIIDDALALLDRPTIRQIEAIVRQAR